MSINLQLPKLTDLEPRLTVVGVGGAGCNAVNNMIAAGLTGVEFVVANTDAQALAASSAEHRVQLGVNLTEGLGAGAKPEIGHAAAEEAVDELRAQVSGSHMVFLAAGMGGGTGTGAASVIARVAREEGILVVGVVTKPFQFEGSRRMRIAEAGIEELKQCVDTLIVIPNQNLFRIANEKTTFAEAFVLADHVLYSGVACIVDLILKEGLINLDFADVRSVMSGMGTAMMGTGEASGERRATIAAEEAISNPLLDDLSLEGAKGLLLSITGGADLTLYEVDEAASRVRKEVDAEATIIVGATFDDNLEDKIRVSIVASGMERLSDRVASSGFMGMKKQLSTLVPNSARAFPDRLAAQEPGNANLGATPQEMQGVEASLHEPPYGDGQLDVVASTGSHTDPALDSPPPVPEQENAPLQQRLSEAIQPGSAPVASMAHDPSINGEWNDGAGPIASEDIAYGQAEPSSMEGDRFQAGRENYPRHDHGDGYGAPQQEQTVEASGLRWQGPSDVMIEEGYPPVSRLPITDENPGNAPAEGTKTDNSSEPAQFQPQPPPSIVRRAPRRMPTVEDFPPVGQREYHAHKGTRGVAPASSEQANALLQNPQPHQHNRKKGLFARLTGFARKQSDSQVSGENRPRSDRKHPVSKPVSPQQRGTHASPEEFSREMNENREGAELPVFFSPQRKA